MERTTLRVLLWNARCRVLQNHEERKNTDFSKAHVGWAKSTHAQTVYCSSQSWMGEPIPAAVSTRRAKDVIPIGPPLGDGVITNTSKLVG